MVPRKNEFEAVVIGASAGGLAAVSAALDALPGNFPAAILVVQHRSADIEDRYSRLLDERCRLPVRQAEEKEPVRGGRVYVAPADYHLLVEEDRTLSLSIDPRVNHARPSVDVLFESAADAYHDTLIGVVLTGAGGDGADGLERIAALGGTAVVQDPRTAEVPGMPEAALRSVPDALVVTLREIGPLLTELCRATDGSNSRAGG